MKKLIFAIIIFSCLAIPAFSQALIQSGAHLKVELAKYDPFPSEAGKLVNVWFRIENDGSDSAEDARFILETKCPLSIPDNDSVRNYGRIIPGDDILLEYRLFVGDDAPKGGAEIVLKYSLGGTSFLEKNFTMTVGEEKERAELKALFVRSDPIPYPGASSTLTMDIVNIDKGTAFFTIVKAESPAATIERNELFIGTLEPDDSDSADFEMEIKDVEPGRYPVSIMMAYKDGDSKELQSTSTIFIDVIPKSAIQAEAEPVWLYILYVIGALILVRIAIPFIHWLIKPVKKIVKKNKGQS